jgi:hypothetical protein
MPRDVSIMPHQTVPESILEVPEVPVVRVHVS